MLFHGGETQDQAYRRIIAEKRWPWFNGWVELISKHLRYEYKHWSRVKANTRARQIVIMMFPPINQLSGGGWKPSINAPISKMYSDMAPGPFKELLYHFGGYRDKALPKPKRTMEQIMQKVKFTDIKGKHNLNNDRIWLYLNIWRRWEDIRSAPNPSVLAALKELNDNPKGKLKFFSEVFKPLARQPLTSTEKEGKTLDEGLSNTIEDVMRSAREIADATDQDNPDAMMNEAVTEDSSNYDPAPELEYPDEDTLDENMDLDDDDKDVLS